jgi:hypothetical protein
VICCREPLQVPILYLTIPETEFLGHILEYRVSVSRVARAAVSLSRCVFAVWRLFRPPLRTNYITLEAIHFTQLVHEIIYFGWFAVWSLVQAPVSGCLNERISRFSIRELLCAAFGVNVRRWFAVWSPCGLRIRTAKGALLRFRAANSIR